MIDRPMDVWERRWSGALLPLRRLKKLLPAEWNWGQKNNRSRLL